MEHNKEKGKSTRKFLVSFRKSYMKNLLIPLIEVVPQKNTKSLMNIESLLSLSCFIYGTIVYICP